MRSSSSSAELDPQPETACVPSSEWKIEANHRLAAHRARRRVPASLQAALPGMEGRLPAERPEEDSAGALPASPRSRSVADRVAARYAKAPTYSEILAAEARNAARAAEAAAVAASEARDAAQAILIGLDVDRHQDPNADRQGECGPAQVAGPRGSQLNGLHSSPPLPGNAATQMPQPLITEATEDREDAWQEESAPPVQPLPAKLIEFPRELIAARRARPRLAEGPLREEFDRSAENSQLRIFEVEHETISTEAVVEPVLPTWSSIRLGSSPDLRAEDHRDGLFTNVETKTPKAAAATPRSGGAAHGFDLPLQTASIEDRLMAAIVDAAMVVAGFLVFVLVFVACTVHPPAGKTAAIGAVVSLLTFSAIYQLLFFNFGQDTPGMRYAKIALCTFEDENPTRQAVRRRLAALLLSASPLGLGVLWAFFDDDRLGWHDRISRTYQRSYR